MFNIVKVKNSVVIKSNDGKDLITLYKGEDDNYELKLNCNLNVTMNGGLQLTTDTLDIVTYGDTSIDTVDSKLWLNSRESKQIREEKYAKEFRIQARKKLKEFENFIDQSKKDLIDDAYQKQDTIVEKNKKTLVDMYERSNTSCECDHAV